MSLPHNLPILKSGRHHLTKPPCSFPSRLCWQSCSHHHHPHDPSYSEPQLLVHGYSLSHRSETPPLPCTTIPTHRTSHHMNLKTPRVHHPQRQLRAPKIRKGNLPTVLRPQATWGQPLRPSIEDASHGAAQNGLLRSLSKNNLGGGVGKRVDARRNNQI